MDKIINRIANFISVKSFVTVVLTCVFAYMTVMGAVSADQFLTVFTVVIAFYFGTQSAKKEGQVAKGGDA